MVGLWALDMKITVEQGIKCTVANKNYTVSQKRYMALIIQVCFKKKYICHGHEELEKIEII